MIVINVPKNLVFSFLEKGVDVYAANYAHDKLVDLYYERVNTILELLEDPCVVYFVVEKEKEGK